MFGLHGILVQSESNLDILFGTLKVGVHTCISKRQCRTYHGNMVYQQNHLYNIIPTCHVCGNNSRFNQN